jgi:hypothetical protein
MNSGRVISEFLKAVARAVDGLSDEEVQQLLRSAGVRGLLRSEGRSKNPARSQNIDGAATHAQAVELMEKLVHMPSREDATSYLRELAPNRLVLLAAAKLREVHVLKQDTNPVIMNKLVENVVGSRLDSAAIRGH